VGRSEAERRVIRGALKDLQTVHSQRWGDPDMLGSLLKRLRKLDVAA